MPAPSLCVCASAGRGGNRWESPDGCLMFSALKRLTIPGQRLPFVQYIVSLAIVKAVESIHAASAAHPATAPVRIKWPNDIYVGTMKIGGILCQSEYHNGAFAVTTGASAVISLVLDHTEVYLCRRRTQHLEQDADDLLAGCPLDGGCTVHHHKVSRKVPFLPHSPSLPRLGSNSSVACCSGKPFSRRFATRTSRWSSAFSARALRRL